MGKSTNNIGKPVGNSLGYTIRMMVTGKTDEKTKKTTKLHTGKFGVYAGKKLIEEVKTIADGMDVINILAKK